MVICPIFEGASHVKTIDPDESNVPFNDLGLPLDGIWTFKFDDWPEV